MSYELFKICLDKATRETQCDDPDKEIEKKHRLLFEDLMSPMPNAWDVYSGYHSIIDWQPIEESSYTRYIENNMKYLFSDNFEDHFEWAHALMMYYRHGGDITKYIEKILEHPTMHIKIMVEFDVFLDKFESRLPEIMEDVSDCISHILNRDTQKLLLEAYENAETPLPKLWVDNWYPLPRKGTRWEKFEEFENTINPLFGFHADNNDEMIINSFAAVFSAIQMVETIHLEKYKRVNAHLGMEYGEEERAPMKSKFAGLRQRALVMHEKLTHLFKIFKGDENHQLIYQRWMSLPAFFTAWDSYTAKQPTPKPQCSNCGSEKLAYYPHIIRGINGGYELKCDRCNIVVVNKLT